eukprot:COSAG06_NODE_1834_length_8257_cov_188.231920_2_plen_65_part_00
MPILASLNAKNRSKSPFSIGMLFSIISDLTVQELQLVRSLTAAVQSSKFAPRRTTVGVLAAMWS